MCPNSSDTGFHCGIACAVSPRSFTCFGPSGSLLVIVKVAVRSPGPCGVNLTDTSQDHGLRPLICGAKGETPQSLGGARLNSPPIGAMLRPVMSRLRAPAFQSCTVIGALGMLMIWSGKSSSSGEVTNFGAG